MQCRVCDGQLGVPVMSGLLLGQNVKYFECANCGYVQTQEPDWLDRAYASAINICDTGIMYRNQANVHLVMATLTVMGNRHGRVVDCAGGYGILVRMLRDSGIEALWSDRYCDNLLSRGFEHNGEPADLVTAFEAFEHFLHPAQELERLLSTSSSVLFSTEIIPEPIPALDKWWYYGPDHGQHIGFFKVKTLQYLAKRFGKHLVTDGKSRHLLTDSPLSSLSWMAHQKMARLFPHLYRIGMRTKIGLDFEKMSQYGANETTTAKN